MTTQPIDPHSFSYDNNQHTILIVEDEKDLASLIEDYLKASGFKTKIISDGNLVIPYIQNNTVDLILLDIQLPNKNGFDICREIRQQLDTPVVFVTARVEEIDRLLGLDLGADDYICKPFSPKEVVARVKIILRRTSRFAVQESSSKEKINLDEGRLILSIEGLSIELTKTEANLFKLLFQDPGKIFSRETILTQIYSDYRVVSNRTVDSHIKKLRKKISDANPASELIHSIYGVGYKYEPPA